MTVHDQDDPALGQPLCGDCYDYESHVVWQWWAPELWRRFTIALRRAVAHHLGVAATDLATSPRCSTPRSPSTSSAVPSTSTP